MISSFQTSVYEVEDYREFLRLYILHCQLNDPKWTVTMWVKQLGLQSLASLNSIFSGRRQCGKRIEKSLLRFFNFTDKEREYFQLLIILSKLNPEEIIYPVLQREIAHRRQFRGTIDESILIFQFKSTPDMLTQIQVEIQLATQHLAEKYGSIEKVDRAIVCSVCLNHTDLDLI